MSTHLDLFERFLGGQVSDATHLRVHPGLDRCARVPILLPEPDGVLVLGAEGPELGLGILPGLHRLIDHGVDALAHLGRAAFAQRLRRGAQLTYQHLSRHEVPIQALKYAIFAFYLAFFIKLFGQKIQKSNIFPLIFIF